MFTPRHRLRFCANCDMEFDGDTKFAVIDGERICEDCIFDMDLMDLLERIGIKFDCIGFPEDERDDY